MKYRPQAAGGSSALRRNAIMLCFIVFGIIAFLSRSLSVIAGVGLEFSSSSSMPSSPEQRPLVVERTTAEATTATESTTASLLVERRNCTDRELRNLMDNKMLGKTGQKSSLTWESRCPSSSWFDEMMAFEYNDDSTDVRKEMLGIAVGCNKAIDAIGTARKMSHDAVYDKNVWVQKLEALTNVGTAGQLCNSKGEELEQYPISENQRKVATEFHCIEPMPSNYHVLSNSSQQLQLPGFHVHQYVIANNDSGTVVAFPDVAFGAESASVFSCGNFRKKHKCPKVDVKKLALDDFCKAHNVNVSPTRLLDALFIDTEGYDLMVLLGARHVLQYTRYLEFEYHRFWPAEATLSRAIDYLDEMDFVCYFQGKGRLYRLTGCLLQDDQYGGKVWSNVACVHRSQHDWYRIMETTFAETLVVSGNVP